MKATNSLLARARAYSQFHSGRTALTIAPLALVGLAASGAEAAALNNPSTVTYGPDTSNQFSFSNGNLSFAGLPPGSNSFTGLKISGAPTYGGTVSRAGTLTMFDLSGTASGNLDPSSDTASIGYSFSLNPNLGPNTVNIIGWTLNVSLTDAGTKSSGSVSGLGAGTFSGTLKFPIVNADAGGALTNYSASLVLQYGAPTGGSGFEMVQLSIPSNSIDISVVPEPQSWALIATAVLGAGLRIACVRLRKSAPDAAAQT